jgi:hypothetical protein
MKREYRIVVKVNNTIQETHDITFATWGNNTHSIAATTIREIGHRLVMETTAPFTIEFMYLENNDEQKEKDLYNFDCS